MPKKAKSAKTKNYDALVSSAFRAGSKTARTTEIRKVNKSAAKKSSR